MSNDYNQFSNPSENAPQTEAPRTSPQSNNCGTKNGREIYEYLNALSEFYPKPDERRDYANESWIGCLYIKLNNFLSELSGVNTSIKYRSTGITNWSVSAEVHDRLLLRHAILKKLENLEATYEVHKNLIDKENTPKTENARPQKNGDYFRPIPTEKDIAPDNPRLRAYRLAATDLFVEKAIAYLEIDCDRYTRRGMTLFIIGIISVFVGIVSSGLNTFECNTDFTASLIGDSHCKHISSISDALYKHPVKYYWAELVSKFTRGFTFYGMIVLLAVGCWRLGKAMLDQAERLRERRHSLRQGRLFIHLNNGNVTIEQLEKAFDWNVSKGNAFANIETEASAPWGAVLKEAVKILPEVFRRAKDSSGK